MTASTAEPSWRGVITDRAELHRAIAEKINQSEKPAAVVCNAHVTALAVVRSLGRRGIPVLALDRDPRGLALHSRYATVRARCPYPLTDEREFVAFLRDMGAAFTTPPVLFPCMDEWVLAVAAHAAQLRSRYRLPFADYAVIDRVLNKKGLYGAAEALGLPLPRTYFLNGNGGEPLLSKLEFPCILKPSYKREFYEQFHSSVRRIDSVEELRHAVRELAVYDLMVQEIIPLQPGALYTYGSYVGADGTPRGEFVGRRLEIYPPGFGTSCVVESRFVPEVQTARRRLLQHFGYRGIAEVEFIHDARDGQYKVLDINTRPWKWIALLGAAGVDLPYLAYVDALGRPESAPAARDGVTWVFLKDYVLLQKVRGLLPWDYRLAENGWQDWLQRQLPGRPLVFGDYSVDDPEPFRFQIRDPSCWDPEHPDAYYCPC